MKEWLMEYFIIPRKERMGIMALVGLLALVWVVPYLWKSAQKADDHYFASKSSALLSSRNSIKVQVHEFDPNTIADEEWLRLGMPEHTVHMIRNYLNKGGHFRKAEALLSIYGIDTSIARTLIPYVKLAGSSHATYAASSVNLNVSTIDARFRKPAQKNITILDINTADSAELEALPWVGEKTASRIIKYREACGGFYAVDQLAGIYGLSDTAFLHFRPYLRIGKKAIRTLNVNQDSLQVLSKHPYIHYKQAKALIAYREQHGPFKRAEDLLLLPLFDQAWLDKISPYLRF